MKKIKSILSIIALLLIYRSPAQNNVLDTLLWENGNYSLVSELDPVWIDQKKGATIKNVQIHTIDTASGNIEYLLNGTYHDVSISNVEKILPGKFCDHVLIFKGNRHPVIVKEYQSDFPYNVKSKFRSRGTYKAKPEVKKEGTARLSETEPDYTQANSAIIFENGKKLQVKLLSINSQSVSYKRLDLLNGPTYIMNLSIPGSMKQARVNTVNGYTIIDYRL